VAVMAAQLKAVAYVVELGPRLWALLEPEDDQRR
jgi:hypothetical protein